MNVLVIGAKGFIGKHLVSFFNKTEKCYEADIIDDNENPNYFKISANSPDFISIFRKEKFDVCINASGAANVGASLSDPVNDFTLNSVNVQKMLEAIRQTQCDCKFILLSSAAVYGNPVKLPINENSQLKPISPYGFHKMIAENICLYYSQIFGLKTYCLRLFSVYGEGIRKQVIWDITNKFLHDKVVELYGTGYETRDFIHVNDVVHSINLICRNEMKKFCIYNIANGEQHTIRDIADYVGTSLGIDKKVYFNNIVKAGDPLNWEADIENIKKLGYEKSMSIKDGIKKYTEWVNCL